MHGICNRSLVYREVVQARSHCKKSYFWLCRNIACDGSTESNQIEKNRVCVPPGCCLEESGRRVGVI